MTDEMKKKDQPVEPTTQELTQEELEKVQGGALGSYSSRAFNPQPEPPKFQSPTMKTRSI